MLYIIFALVAGYVFVSGYVLGFAERDSAYGVTWFDWLFAALWLPFLISYFSSALAKKVFGESD